MQTWSSTFLIKDHISHILKFHIKIFSSLNILIVLILSALSRQAYMWSVTLSSSFDMLFNPDNKMYVRGKISGKKEKKTCHEYLLNIKSSIFSGICALFILTAHLSRCFGFWALFGLLDSGSASVRNKETHGVAQEMSQWLVKIMFANSAFIPSMKRAVSNWKCFFFSFFLQVHRNRLWSQNADLLRIITLSLGHR